MLLSSMLPNCTVPFGAPNTGLGAAGVPGFAPKEKANEGAGEGEGACDPNWKGDGALAEGAPVGVDPKVKGAGEEAAVPLPGAPGVPAVAPKVKGAVLAGAEAAAPPEAAPVDPNVKTEAAGLEAAPPPPGVLLAGAPNTNVPWDPWAEELPAPVAAAPNRGAPAAVAPGVPEGGVAPKAGAAPKGEGEAWDWEAAAVAGEGWAPKVKGEGEDAEAPKREPAVALPEAGPDAAGDAPNVNAGAAPAGFPAPAPAPALVPVPVAVPVPEAGVDEEVPKAREPEIAAGAPKANPVLGEADAPPVPVEASVEAGAEAPPPGVVAPNVNPPVAGALEALAPKAKEGVEVVVGVLVDAEEGPDRVDAPVPPGVSPKETPPAPNLNPAPPPGMESEALDPEPPAAVVPALAAGDPGAEGACAPNEKAGAGEGWEDEAEGVVDGAAAPKEKGEPVGGPPPPPPPTAALVPGPAPKVNPGAEAESVEASPRARDSAPAPGDAPEGRAPPKENSGDGDALAVPALASAPFWPKAKAGTAEEVAPPAAVPVAAPGKVPEGPAGEAGEPEAGLETRALLPHAG